MKSEERNVLLSEKVPKYDTLNDCVNDREKETKNEETKNDETQENECEDDSAWFIVAASFLCICVLDGTMYSFGSFLDPLMAEMKDSRSTISIAGSLQVALSAFVAPVAAWFVERKGTRLVCLAGAVTASFGLLLASFGSSLVGIFGGLSLLTGTGFGLMYIPAVVAVAENFAARRSLAVALCLCGAGAGQVAMAPLVTSLIQTLGWRGALQVMSCLALACAGLGVVMKQPSHRVKSSPHPDDWDASKSFLSLLLGPKIGDSEHVVVFLVVVVADALAVMALYIPYSYLQQVARASGVQPYLSTLLISAIGVGSVSGRLLAGWLSDQPWCHPLYITRLVVTMASPLPFLFSWVDHFWMFVGIALLFGFLTGQWIAATSPLLVSLLGIDQLSQAFGLLTFVRGVASLISPPLAGMLVDLTINPLIALYFSGGLLLVSGGVYSLSIFVLNRRFYRQNLYQKI